MNLNFNSYFTLALVLVTFCVSACQGQSSACDISSTPHPDGLCGSMLSRVHSNVCFLLRQMYPEHFQRKRSAGDSYVQRIPNVPLSVLAELELNSNSGDVLDREREAPYDLLNSEVLSADAGYRPHLSKHQLVYADGTRMAKTVFQLLSGKGYDRLKRNVGQSSMVCDCCYNVCTLRHLATYC